MVHRGDGAVGAPDAEPALPELAERLRARHLVHEVQVDVEDGGRGVRLLPDDVRHGILPKGHVLRSPCRRFYLQLIAPRPEYLDVEPDEMLQRIGFGTPDVLRAVTALRARGVEFVESKDVHSETRGALTQGFLGGVMFELVHDESH